MKLFCNRISLILSFFFIFCICSARTINAEDTPISQKIFSQFQTLGSELALDIQETENLLNRIKQAHDAGRHVQGELAEFRRLRSSIIVSYRALFAKLDEMEQELIDNGADSMFIERHRKMSEGLKEKLSWLSERLSREDIDDLATRGLGFTLKKETPADKKARISKSKNTSSQSKIQTPKYHIGAIKKPKRTELKDEQPKIFPRSDEKLGLIRKNNQFKLVAFQHSEDKTDPKSLLQNPQSINSHLRISDAVAWDLNLPQSVRPVMVAGLGDLTGLLSQATINAVIPPLPVDLQEDGVDVVFTDEIKSLAVLLNKDPIKIYEYVKNNFEYQPYWGSLKGAHETLLEKQGNDTDLASLLIALLRYSGYPARYGEAKAIVDIKRAKSWLGVEDDTQAGYLLATAGVPEVEDLYRGSQLVQVKFKHVYAEVYLPYDNYRGQIRGGNSARKLWVPLSPSFKKHRETAGINLQAAVPFDSEAFLQQLKSHAVNGPDGSITGMDAAFINSQMEAYGRSIAGYVNTHNPDMTIRELYGYQEIIKENDLILPITLPFESEEAIQSSKLTDEQRHRIAVKLSYHGIDLDEELETLEINYSAPTAQVAGKRLTLSYRPATVKDEQLLQQYDGNLLGTPLYLIHLYPQLKIDGEVAAENTGEDAEISMGLDENLRIEILKPGETVPAERKSDYLITAGDHVAIVPCLGSTPKEHLTTSLNRLEAAISEETPDIDRLLGEQLHLTGSAYYYQTGMYYDLAAKQAEVTWFNNPSDLTVSRHFNVAWVADMFPVAIKEATIIVDAAGLRYQAIPKKAEWDRRVAFLKAAGVYGSIMEHTVLMELYQQDAVSGAKLIKLASDNGTEIYEITKENRSDMLSRLTLPAKDMAIITRELDLGQTVIAPKKHITIGTYNGAGIISTTPSTDPMGSFREGYFISRGADGGQICQEIKNLLSDFVNPEFQNWFDFKAVSGKGVSSIITSSDSIREGSIKVKEMINGLAGMAMSLYMMRAQATASSMMCLGSLGAMNISLNAMEDFLNTTYLIYMDFENNAFYYPDQNNGYRTVKYFVVDLLGQGVQGKTPEIFFTCNEDNCTSEIEKNISPTDEKGAGAFTFKKANARPDDKIEIKLTLASPDGKTIETTGTVIVEGCGIKALSIEDAEDNYPVRAGGQAEVKAETRPADMPLKWSFKKVSEKKNILIDIIPQGTACTIKVHDNTESGWIILKVEDAENSGCFKEMRVYVGCASCEKAQGGSCPINPGLPVIDLGSVDVQLSLGKAKGGIPAGDLFINAKEPSPELATPGRLVFSSIANETEAFYDAGGTLRQVAAQQSFVTIVKINDFSYTINFYNPDARGAKSVGYYQIDPSATPLIVWRIENPDASSTMYNRIRLTEIKDAFSKVYEYNWNEGSKTWSLTKGNGLQVRTKAVEVDAENNLIETEAVYDASNIPALKTRITYHQFPWGKSVVEKVQDPDAAALTATMSYYDNQAMPGCYGRIKSQVNPDGSWSRYQYDSRGRKIQEIRAFLDVPYTDNATVAAARTVQYDYSSVDAADANAVKDAYRPRTVTEIIKGTIVAKTWYAYRIDSSNNRIDVIERCAGARAGYGDARNERTVRTYYKSGTAAADSGKIKSILYFDGRLDSYTYEQGTFIATPDPSLCAFTPGTGAHVRETVVHGTSGKPAGIAFKTTKETGIQDVFGNEVLRESYVYGGSSYDRVQWSVKQYDEKGYLIKTIHSNGTVSESTWSCCGKESDTDERGIKRLYMYDALQRVVSETKQGAGTQANITSSYTYDAAGRRLTAAISSQGITQSSGSSYDLSGRLISSSDSAGLITSYIYAQNGLVSTVVHPGNAAEVTTRYLDGRVKNVTGTGVVPRYYEYGVNSDGTQWTKISTGSAASPLWEKSTADILGRTVKVEKPGFAGVELTESFYNSKGQLIKTTAAGQADTLYAYDDFSNQLRSGLDIDGNGSLDLASSDRISQTESLYAQESGAWWQKSVQQIYATENAAAATILTTQMSRLTGLSTGGLVSEDVASDINNNRTVTRVVISRSAQLENRTTRFPDSTIDETSASVNGLLISAKSRTGVETAFVYDALGRRTGIIDPRTGTGISHYNSKGRVDYVEDSAHNRTTYIYDNSTGLKISESNADNRVNRYAYNTKGQVTHTWGDSPYPVQYEYDNYGRLSQMYTFRDNTNWNAGIWPVTTGTGDVTAWQYDEATGLLTRKIDAEGRGVFYTYTAGGRIATRTWARKDGASPLVTTYTYSPVTGELIKIDYSDATPDVFFTYDRLGRQKTVTDKVGTRNFTFNNSLLLESEQITGLYNNTITRSYETTGVTGRSTGVTLGSDYSVSYGYDSTGRFNAAGWTAAGRSGTVSYAYVPASDLIQSLSTGSGQQTTYSYDPLRNLRTQIRNEYNGSLISQYDYSYDSLGRRTNVVNTGTAFTQAGYNRYGYNDRNELTASTRYTGADINDTTNPVEVDARAYAFDPIGNRKAATEAAKQLVYTANQLNQYQVITQGSAPVTQNFTYDADGNLTATTAGSAQTVYRYDSENRLAEVSPSNPVDGSRKVEYQYDYLSRRVQKKVSTYSSGSWILTSDSLFLYDGWNLIRELSTQNSAHSTASYVWGLDLSGTLQGAGGIGGLLARVKDGVAQQYTYDGNGNVSELLNNDGSIAAHYEYDPYGNAIVVTSSDNPFRYSTKFFDDETGLGYWGYRFYSPVLGRWLNKDPLEEEGSLNFYGYASNNPISVLDPNGLYDFIASGTGSLLLNIPGKKSDYLQEIGYQLLNNDKAGKWGSRASFAGYFLTLGLSSSWDASREAKYISDESIKRNDDIDRGMGHSQGVRICLQAIYKAAVKCNKFIQEGGESCCKEEKIIKLVLMAPKVSAGYIDEIHQQVKSLMPKWDLLMMVVYSPTDRLVPKGGLLPWSGSYKPTDYAQSNYILEPIIAPWPSHSSVYHTGEESPQSVEGQGETIERDIKGFFR